MSAPVVRDRRDDVPIAEATASSGRRLWPQERLSAGYFGVTGVLVALFGRPFSAWWPVLLLHVGLVALLVLVFPRLPKWGWIQVLRDWAPVLGLTFIYAEIAILNHLFTTGDHDAVIQRAELALFGTQPSVTLRELLPWKPLSEYLHFGYIGYYALIPLLGGSLYLRRRFTAYRYVLTVILSVFYFCYLCFIVFPVAGPWYHFPRPEASQVGWLFPYLIRVVLAAGSSKGAAFPSSHVAAAVVMWLLAWRLERPLFWVFAAIVPALVVGTVYGGFHYGLDALTGIVIGILGYLCGPWLYQVLGGEVVMD